MEKPETIFVIKNTNQNKYKIKGSLFIGIAEKISSSMQANSILNQIRKKYYDATHHCFAYQLLNNEEKYSDDGEPNGTAGIRILNAIKHFGITNVIVIIVRYFGGTKLGVGPLGKAYSQTAMSLLENTEFLKLKKYNKIKIIYNYEDSRKIHYLINKFTCKKIVNGFEQKPVINCLVETAALKNFIEKLNEQTKGNAIIKTDSKSVYVK